jgi:hypothetical protein
MKCVRCGTDNNLSDRTAHSGRCKNCNHPFAFEPSAVTDNRFKFTDPFFAKAIDDISANNTLYFTPKQFLYLLDRRFKKVSSGLWLFSYLFFSVWTTGFFGGFLSLAIGESSFIIVWIIFNIGFVINLFRASSSSKLTYKGRKSAARGLQVVGGLLLAIGIILSTVVLKSFSVFGITVVIGMLSIYLGTRQQLRLTRMSETFLVEPNQFQDWVYRWQQVNEPISKMLPFPREEIAPNAVSPDISAYSFDRAVICDSAAIAQMLIANNFHFENNCAVLSITGYPQSIFETVMQMLNRNPDLKVYALHDASPRGVGLVHRLRTSPNWFQNSNAMIYDLGLLPRQIFSARNVFIQASEDAAQQARLLPPEVRQSLSSDELAWLETGKFVELESFTPQRIIQVLNQGITRSQDTGAGDSLVLIDGGGDGGGGYIYAADSFG